MTNNKPLLHILPLLLLLLVQKSSSQLYTLNLPEPVTETEVEVPIVTETDDSFPQAVIDVMSSREMRYHHFLWHNIRDNWNRFTADVQEQISSLGWEPPRPARAFEGLSIVALTDNDSGEDFLYMHRQMITKFKEIVEQVGSGYDISGWKTIPAPDDLEYPAEPYDIPGNSSVVATINQTKTDGFYNDQLVPMEETFEDADSLRDMTLGQLGSRIENTIHNWMHLRFSTASSVGYRPSTTDAFPDIDAQWDNPEYNWLGDTYSSHVNPIFWKLHGWVDARIDDWQTANGVQEIQWNGTWIGGPMETLMDLLQIPDLEAAILNIEDNEVSFSNLEAQLNTINGVNTDNVKIDVAAVEPNTFEPENIEISTEDVVTLTANEMDNPSFSPSCSFADNIQVNFGSIGKVVAIGVSEPDPVSQPGVFSSTWSWKKAL